MLATLGRFEESAAQYVRAIEQAPGDPSTRVDARVLAALGRRAQALEQARAALELAPGMVEALDLETALRGGAG